MQMQCDPEGDPWQCAKRGDEDGIKRLLQRSDVNDWINQAGDCIARWPPLHLASRSGHLEVAKLLLLSGADINYAAIHGSTPLLLASFNGHLDVVKLLISSGAQISCTDHGNLSALDYAIGRFHIEIVDTLLSAGAYISNLIADFGKRNDAMADVILRHLRWRRRKYFLLFLATQNYLSRVGEIRGDVQDWLESRLLSSPVHRVLMTEDLQRLLVSYL